MKLRKLSQTLLVAAAFASTSAMAAQITYDSTLASVRTDQDGQSLSFQQFNSSMGTLNSVTLSFDTTISTTIVATALPGSDVYVSLMAELFLTHPNTTQLYYGSATLFDEHLLSVGGSGTASTGGSIAINGSGLTISASDFALFTHTGPGTGYALAPLYVMSSSLSEGDDAHVAFNTYVAGTAHVTYDYTVAAVPEPETYGMMLLGLGMVGLVAQRKSRAART